MQLSDLNWPAVQALPRDTPVVFPVAALEQHGHHLPLFTDSLLLGEIIRRAAERLAELLLFAPYWQLGHPWEGEPRLQQREMGHACEWETSMVLRLAPRLVGGLESLEPISQGNAFEPAARGWTTKDRTSPGHLGNPRAA